MNNKELAQKLIEYSGGSENISKAIHCITRIRFNLKDDSKVDIEAVENLKGVIGAQFQNGKFQIIIGVNVSNVYAETAKLLNLNSQKNEDNKDEPKKEKKNIISNILD